MCGSGKSLVADRLVAQGYGYVRFGQLTIDELNKQGLPVTPENEKMVREELRQEHGKAAFAKLNIAKFDQVLREKNLVADGLYSWSEYKFLKDYYADRLIVLAVYASPRTRYARLAARTHSAEDKDYRNRPLTAAEARSRDYAEIENIEKGGPIVMADYTLINEGTPEELYQQLDKLGLY